MTANFRGGAQNTGTGVTVTVTAVPPPTANSYVLMAVGISTITNTVTGITGGTGTFVRATSGVSASNTLEMWVGYNFGTSLPTSIVVTRDAGAANMVVQVKVIDVYADCSAAPSFTASTMGLGVSTAPDTNTLTPAVGDIMMAACVLASTTADSTVRTHTGNNYLNNANSELTNVHVEQGWCEAAAAASSKEVWTTGSTTWGARQVLWTPAAPLASTAALIVKGLTTASADAASSF